MGSRYATKSEMLILSARDCGEFGYFLSKLL